MTGLRLSRRAEADLLAIGAYTLRNWGASRAADYIDNLEACCQTLAANPEMGRACDNIRPGLRRMECGRHVVFYRQDADRILVLRVLHQRMLPERQLLDDDDG